MSTKMTTTTVAPWFGSNRTLAAHVGEELKGRKWVGIPFAGGMCELPWIDARTIVVNDLHRHVINLARVIADSKLGPAFYRKMRRYVFHPDHLSIAQQRCRMREESVEQRYGLFELMEAEANPNAQPDLWWAEDYFASVWMGRSGKAGTDDEFTGKLSIRWNANGGDSAVRFHSAVASIPAWRRVLRRCSFETRDAFDFIARTEDAAGNALYCDPPFPDAGNAYRHKFDEAKHRRLAEWVSRFSMARVVMRFYDDPLIREIYPESRWTWVRRIGRKQTNGEAPEVLIINGPSHAEAP